MDSKLGSTKLKYRWVLWYHDPENSDYSVKSYIQIADINNPIQFWLVVDSISKEKWESGMFFFMKDGYKPIWDCAENEGGGAWSKKIEAAEAHDVFIDLMVNAMADELLNSRKETLVGITISPKGPFSIIKIWNTSTTVSSNTYLNPKIHKFKVGDDVTYTAHKSRPR